MLVIFSKLVQNSKLVGYRCPNQAKLPWGKRIVVHGLPRGTERCSTNSLDNDGIISAIKFLKMFVAQNSRFYLFIICTYYDSLYVIIWKPNCWPSEIINTFTEKDKRRLFTSQTVLSVLKNICKHHRPTNPIRIWKWPIIVYETPLGTVQCSNSSESLTSHAQLIGKCAKILFVYIKARSYVIKCRYIGTRTTT